MTFQGILLFLLFLDIFWIQKCLETEKQPNPLKIMLYGKCLETGETTNFLEKNNFSKGFCRFSYFQILLNMESVQKEEKNKIPCGPTNLTCSWLLSIALIVIVNKHFFNCMLLLYCRKFVMVSPASPCFFSLTWFPVWLCVTKNFPSSNILKATKKIFDILDGNHEGVWCPWIQSKNGTPSPH